MYELIITTKNNEIKMTIDDYNSSEIKKLLEQPDIISVELHKIKVRKKVKV